MCLAVIDNTDALVASATLRTTDSGLAEEGAIALAIVHASTLPSQPDAPVTIVTDSQAACRAFAHGLVAAHTHNILFCYYRQRRYTYPPPHPSLNRADAVAWRQLQTNSFPCLYMLHLFHPTLYPSYCPYCGSEPTVYHSTWKCSSPRGVPPIPNPTLSSWESALLSLGRKEQQQLVQRARRVVQGNGALD
ncbi:uncharacterized protein LOC125944977 [Dermacentor silvarum]|uniref:uncharacterized protein LOC125944977 n=1 Tax=Dermacentor silvarum TaxID=543639 RepID=UPI0021016D4A|nr:uncharacterized protein LOC125944977 [Dermacentor silvarum]